MAIKYLRNAAVPPQFARTSDGSLIAFDWDTMPSVLYVTISAVYTNANGSLTLPAGALTASRTNGASTSQLGGVNFNTGWSGWGPSVQLGVLTYKMRWKMTSIAVVKTATTILWSGIVTFEIWNVSFDGTSSTTNYTQTRAFSGTSATAAGSWTTDTSSPSLGFTISSLSLSKT